MRPLHQLADGDVNQPFVFLSIVSLGILLEGSSRGLLQGGDLALGSNEIAGGRSLEVHSRSRNSRT